MFGSSPPDGYRDEERKRLRNAAFFCEKILWGPCSDASLRAHPMSIGIGTEKRLSQKAAFFCGKILWVPCSDASLRAHPMSIGRGAEKPCKHQCLWGFLLIA